MRLIFICALIHSHFFFFLLFSRAKSYAHARSRSRPQPAPKHAQWLYEYAPQQPRLHGWLQSHRAVFTGHASSEPNEHDPGAAHGKLWAPAKHEHAAKSRWNDSFVALLLLMLLPSPPQHIPCSCWELFCNASFFFIIIIIAVLESFLCMCGFLSLHGAQQDPWCTSSLPPSSITCLLVVQDNITKDSRTQWAWWGRSTKGTMWWDRGQCPLTDPRSKVYLSVCLPCASCECRPFFSPTNSLTFLTLVSPSFPFVHYRPWWLNM